MRIVYLFRSIAVKGGAERILIDKINYLANQPGYELFLLTYEQGVHQLAYPLLPQITYTDMGVMLFRRFRYGFFRRQWMYIRLGRKLRQRLSQQIAAIDPDIIICTSYAAIELSILSQMKDRSKKIIESHLAKMAIGQQVQHPGKGILNRLASISDQNTYRNIRQFDAFVTLTQADALSWKPIKETLVIPNMLSYYPPEINDALPKSERIISVGRLQKEKGYDLLIQSWELVFKVHPNWVLDIYGEGDERETLERNIAESGLENVVVLHPITNAIYEKYMESDFYVMSSRWEGFGLVLIEAMSCGIPCVSFDCPHGPSDIIRNGEDGLLVENGNVAQLAEKICYLIEHEDIRREMGRKARENVKRYLPENIMPQWEKLFNDLTTTL